MFKLLIIALSLIIFYLIRRRLLSYRKEKNELVGEFLILRAKYQKLLKELYDISYRTDISKELAERINQTVVHLEMYHFAVESYIDSFTTVSNKQLRRNLKILTEQYNLNLESLP